MSERRKRGNRRVRGSWRAYLKRKCCYYGYFFAVSMSSSKLTFRAKILSNGNRSEQRMFPFKQLMFDSITLILSANVVLRCKSKTKRFFISQLSRESFAVLTFASRYPWHLFIKSSWTDVYPNWICWSIDWDRMSTRRTRMDGLHFI